MRRRSVPVALAGALLALAAPTAAAATAGETLRLLDPVLPAGSIPGAPDEGLGFLPPSASVSENGDFVAFVSHADTFDPAANPNVQNVFRKDRESGAVVLVSRADGLAGLAPGASSSSPVISADGSRIAFVTTARLDPADTDDGGEDVYVRDVESNRTIFATPGGAQDHVNRFDLSGDGLHVAFDHPAQLDPAADGNNVRDVYLRTLGNGADGVTRLVSTRSAGAAAAGNAASTDPSLAENGRFVAFTSRATDLTIDFVQGAGAQTQVFVRDMSVGGVLATRLVSRDPATAATGGNGDSDGAELAVPDGLEPFVAYRSRARDVSPTPAPTTSSNVYIRRGFALGPSFLVSRPADGIGFSSALAPRFISDDGNRVAFYSFAQDLVPGGLVGSQGGVFVRDVAQNWTGLVSRVAVDDPLEADDILSSYALSRDGNYMAWFDPVPLTDDTDPQLGGTIGHVIGPDLVPLAPELLSRPAAAGRFLAGAVIVREPNASGGMVSGNGRYVVFASASPVLPGAGTGAAAGRTQVYRKNLVTGETLIVSRTDAGAAGLGDSFDPTISADGMRVAFSSEARSLLANPSGAPIGPALVHVRDFRTGTLTLVSRANGPDGVRANNEAGYARISADGGHVAFESKASNLGPPQSRWHVYVRGIDAGTTELVDRASAADGGALSNELDLDGGSAVASVADGGRYVVFASRATNLHDDDTTVGDDVFVRDRMDDVTTLVSRGPGVAGPHATGDSHAPMISADGSVVAFVTDDQTLAPEAGPWDFGVSQVVARRLEDGQNTLVSLGPSGGAADADAVQPSVSADGSVVAFTSAATNLLPGVGGVSRSGVFARDVGAGGELTGPPAFGLVETILRRGFAASPSISADGDCLAFLARGHNAATGRLAGDFITAYMHVVAGECPKPDAPDPDPDPDPDPGPRDPGPPGPPPPGPPTPPGPPARPSVTTPTVTRPKLSSTKLRPGRRPVTIAFTLNAAATVTVTVERAESGRKVGGACRPATRKLRGKPACTRYVVVGRLPRRDVTAGAATIAFDGRVGRRALAPGSYRLGIRAHNEAGASPVAHLRFTVARR